MENPGNAAMIIAVRSMIPINGQRFFMILLMGVCPTFAETKSIVPTGGVRAPDAVMTWKSVPKCTGFMPYRRAMG